MNGRLSHEHGAMCLFKGVPANMQLLVSHIGEALVGLALLSILLGTGGCGPALPAASELSAFDKAGPVQPAVDLGSLMAALRPPGPYRVVTGDVLELHMPAVMRLAVVEQGTPPDRLEPHLCRVGQDGTISLPRVGTIPAAGQTLAEIESAVAASFFPRYLVHRPAVVARVAEYDTQTVSVVGVVKEPGVYQLQSNQMSLLAALMKAGGILTEGAAAIQIHRPGQDGVMEPLLVPIKGLSVPFVDVALRNGDTVEVQRINPQQFMVIGLVNAPGAFPYPPESRYNLMQALAFAGGLNDFADPQYAKVYRQDASGKVVAAVFKLDGQAFTAASNIAIKPGDVVAVEHTALTRTRYLLREILRVGLGVTVRYDLYNNDDDNND